MTIVYEEKFIYIRAANSIWYEISLTNGKVMMKNYVGKKNRQGTFVYIHENASKDIGLLK